MNADRTTTVAAHADQSLAPLIDHTILRPDATEAQIRLHCDEARAHGFAAVCVNPIHVALVARCLAGSVVKTCSVIGFPFGATPTANKVAETARALADGATEIDMVIALGALKEGRDDAVREDIAAVKGACGDSLLKVIIETFMLDDAQKMTACRLAAEAGADFVKTSTGYGGGGATLHDVGLMRRAVGDRLGVKASGGIRDATAARAMIAAGASRIGASSGVALVTGDMAGAGY